MVRKILLILLFISFTSSVVLAKSRAYVDKNNIVIGEAISLTIVLDGNGRKPDFSFLKKNFRVIDGEKAIAFKVINGKSLKEIHYKFILIPNKTGKITIEPIRIKTDRAEEFTKRITINVVRKKTASKKKREVFIQSLLSNNAPFLNEQIIYTLKFYRNVEVTNLNYIPPAFKGFLVNKLDPDRTYRQTVNGLLYNVIELKYLLIPIKSGKTTIDKGEFSCAIILRDKRHNQNPFNSFLGNIRTKKQTLYGELIDVEIKKLPDNTPKNFSNIVGKIALSVSIKKNKLKKGESTTLFIKVKGDGNLMDFHIPNFNISDDFKVYRDKPEEKIIIVDTGYSGEKTFRFAIVPLSVGKFTIKPFEISYFDIIEKKYKILKSKELKITVDKNTEEIDSFPNDTTTSKVKKRGVKFIKKGILPIKEDLSSIKDNSPLSFFRFIILVMFIPLCFLFLKIALIILKEKTDAKTKMLKKASKSFKKAKSFDDDFLTNLYSGITYTIYAKANKTGEGISYEEATNILKDANFDDILTKRIILLLEKIDSVKFSGISIKKDYKSMFDETKQLLKKIK